MSVIRLVANFNSTMVRLKDGNVTRYCICYIYFNSTMVRLKGTFARCSAIFFLFQFHYGTIKSAFATFDRNKSESISIPLWYD